ncbi:GHKL domain-containing protein [Aquibacillus halophilus]|uniref:histidine kinase n=1 Tax=Aquibacillus halophilus TaxID=930132 RepID=A0A6A8DKF5_9BACI|nr:histidine kinase dimerization/phospho-acceptor domain-containing protein [Aquibacillus halophilus]MRH43467.1 GHKL domain-containing protein [Aquibacillus halophilus]
MATKWKSKVIICIIAILFTFNLSGILFLANYGTYYAQKDYFHTSKFQDEIDEFARYLSMFELNSVPLDEAKESLTVTEEEINEHRYRYGDLPEQINGINSQYEHLIQGALDTGSQQVADTYIAERDAKIEDITKNFESDEYVEAKVIKEKEELLGEYYNERENYRSDFLRLKENFKYYFTDRVTGEVYSNLDYPEDELAPIDPVDMLYVTNYSIGEYVKYAYVGGYAEELIDSITPTNSTVEGEIAVPKSFSWSNPIMEEYHNYRQEQILFWSYVAASVLAFILILIIIFKSKGIKAEVSNLETYYNKLSIDVRAVLFGLTGIATIITTLLAAGRLLYIFDHSLIQGFFIAVGLLIGTVGIGLTFIQGKFLAGTLKDWKNFKCQLEKSLLNKMTKRLKVVFRKVVYSLKTAFLDQTTGTQLFIVLGLIFLLGISVIMTIVHPIFVIFYIILLGAVGLPLVMVLVNRIGYFNQIVEKTNELAKGNLGNDLQVTGKSVFAQLASNINVLKQGVRASQNEQAKSERLKTELITNVSHDLRTPLTSIITYTELLKSGDVSSDESAAYLEIIDRKSQRLKVLIDDLFEVSKMASGNIQLTKEKVDLVQLLQQALAEYDDTINDSSLQFRITNIDKPVYSLVDGQKLWRVFDNLIGNILKYSLEYSRVYINLSTKNDRAIITFKNVSKYELGENSDELFERFKRGDTSRQTEGSGLGLAIAQSIVDLHEGSLDMDTDGDLFKVCISLKLEE